jgi:hypothetical protein
VPEVDQHARIRLQRNIAQDLGELACGEFAGSTGAADHLGQPLLAQDAHHSLTVNRAPSLRESLRGSMARADADDPRRGASACAQPGSERTRAVAGPRWLDSGGLTAVA